MVIEILIGLVTVLAGFACVAAFSVHRELDKVQATQRVHDGTAQMLARRLDAAEALLKEGPPPDELRAQAVDMGIALAERMSKINRGPAGEKRLQGADKARIAVEYALEQAKILGVEMTGADARKLIEARLETQPTK